MEEQKQKEQIFYTFDLEQSKQLVKNNKKFYKQKSKCCVYDFTLKRLEETPDKIAKELLRYCKKGGFQGEISIKLYRHWQGRISLNHKAYIWDVLRMFNQLDIMKAAHWSLTATENIKDPNFYRYICKLDTREEGPYNLTEFNDDLKEMVKKGRKPSYIPYHMRVLAPLRPFQKSMLDISRTWIKNYYSKPTAGPHARGLIHVIGDFLGGRGKGYLGDVIYYHFLEGFLFPAINDRKELMRTVYNYYARILNGARNSEILMFNMTRAQNKSKLNDLYGCIEQILDGKLWEDRYTTDYYPIDTPCVWIFTNQIPDKRYMSSDRWRLYGINEKKELVQVKSKSYLDECLEPVMEDNNFSDSESDLILD